MTNLYNLFLKPGNYVSEISFISSFIKYENFYVEFSECLKNDTGLYADNNNYLKYLYWTIRNRKNVFPLLTWPDDETYYLNMTNNLITNIIPRTVHYTYIKVIKDKQNPQLEGQVMILRFGTAIGNIISKYESGIYKNSFILTVDKKSGFPCFDNCHFSKNEMNFFDKNLDIKSEICFKKFNLKAIERREKLKKINITKNEEI